MGRMYYYKGVRVNAFGIPVFKVKTNLEKENRRNRIRKREYYYLNFHSKFQKDAPKNLVVMYDIPHEKKKERDWFRRQLKKFDYIMIQKSVWVGPSPLPEDFMDYVKLIGLSNKLKTFRLAKPYTKNTRIMK